LRHRFIPSKPDKRLDFHERKLALDAQHRKLKAALRASFTRKASRLDHLAGVLRVLTPDSTLGRGYSITFDAAGSIIRRKGAVHSGDQIPTRFPDGSIDYRVQ